MNPAADKRETPLMRRQPARKPANLHIANTKINLMTHHTPVTVTAHDFQELSHDDVEFADQKYEQGKVFTCKRICSNNNA
jgi:hypothetical protein